jgi:hypothetical protein
MLVLTEGLCMAVVQVDSVSTGSRKAVKDVCLMEDLVDRDGGECRDSEDLRSNAGIEERLFLHLGVAGRILPEGHFNVLGRRCSVNLRQQGIHGEGHPRPEEIDEVRIEEVSIAFIALPGQVPGTRGPGIAKGKGHLQTRGLHSLYERSPLSEGLSVFLVTKTDRIVPWKEDQYPQVLHIRHNGNSRSTH